MSSSSSSSTAVLATTPMDRYFGYSLVCPAKTKPSASIPSFNLAILSVVKNNLNQKATDRVQKDYLIEKEDNPLKWAQVYSQDKAPQANSKKAVFLGYDQTLNVWYTPQKSAWKMQNFFEKLALLTSEQLKLVSDQERSDVKSYQQRAIDSLKELLFAPPLLWLQETNPTLALSIPRQPGRVQAVNVTDVSVENVSQFFTTLLKVNKGFFLGSDHYRLENGMIELLIDLMPTFRAAGMRLILDELPAFATYSGFQQFNADDQCKEVNLGRLRPQFMKERTRLYQAAKDNQIQVCGFDANAFENNNSSVSLDMNKLLTSRNQAMVQNADFFVSKLKNEEKYMTLNGYGHYDMARMLAVPNIYFEVQTESSNASGSHAATSNLSASEESAISLEAVEARIKQWEDYFRNEKLAGRSIRQADFDKHNNLANYLAMMKLGGQDHIDKVHLESVDFTVTYAPRYAGKSASVTPNNLA